MMLDVALAVARRTWRRVRRRPVVLTFSLGQPLIWMLLFGFLFQRFRPLAGGIEVPYLDFLAPGVCAMTVLFGASQAGVEWIRDLQTGFLPRLLASPAGAAAILLGKVVADVVRLLFQAAAVVGLALALGVRFETAPVPLALGALALGLFAAAAASLSSAVAFVARAPEPMATFVHLINMPLLFTSTALVPAEAMPPWLAAIARWNPLSWAVDAWRGALLTGAAPESLATSLSALAVLAAALFLVATAAMRRLAALS